MQTIEFAMKRFLVSMPLVIVCCLHWATWTTVVRAQDTPLLLDKGLDVVVLVDISRSMRHFPPKPVAGQPAKAEPVEEYRVPNGSDPEKVRWDAVKLLLDLLTDNDRLLIQRFNSQCPPAYGPEQIRLLNQATSAGEFARDALKYSAESEFPFQFETLDQIRRETLENKILYFGASVDHGDFDAGNTGILAALDQVATRVQRPEAGRQTVVLLLTDGLDDKYNFSPQSPQELLEDWASIERYLAGQLKFYAGTTGNGIRVPIYSIGLNLNNIRKNQDEQKWLLAKQFLASISSLSGGEFQDVSDNRHLVQGFRGLIWSLKDSWVREYRLEGNNRTEAAGTYVDQRIVDVSVLGLERDPKAMGPKNTRPPAGGLHFNWKELPAGMELTEPDRRSGMNQSVYEYLHWGRVSASQGLGSDVGSPFKKLSTPAWLSVNVDRSPNTREIWISKRTSAQLFRVTRPRDDEKLHRLQYLPLEVEMADVSGFRPDQFEVTARVFPLGGEGQGDTAQILATEILRAETQPMGRHTFSGKIDLEKIAYDDEAAESYYTLAFTIDGLDKDKNPLAHFRLELPRRTIRVNNRLSLKSIPDVLLTRDRPDATIKLEPDHPLDKDVPLMINFIAPKSGDQSLELKHFLPFADKVILKSDGITEFKISLNQENLPKAEMQYVPGEVIFTASKNLHLSPMKPMVKVSIDLAQVAIEPSSNDLSVKDILTSSGLLSIQLRPANQPKGGIKRLKLSLLQQEIPKSAEGKQTEFTAQELWLQIGEGTEATSEGNRVQELTDVPLNAPIRVFTLPAKSKNSGTYHYKLRVEGIGIDTSEANLRLLVSPPVLEVKEKELVVNASPGTKRQATIYCRLKAGQPNDQDEIRIVEGAGGRLFDFLNSKTNDSTSNIVIDAPGTDDPIVVKAIDGTIKNVESPGQLPTNSNESEGWTAIPVLLTVPEDLKYGYYHSELTLAGKRVESQKVKINLVVNDLKLEWPVLDEGQGIKWQSVDSLKLIQFFDSNMRKKVRVRSELSNLLKPQDIRQRFIGPFKEDGTGDEQKIPKVGSIITTPDGRALEIELIFDHVVNANQLFPYQVELMLESPTLGTAPKGANLSVWYLEPARLFVSEPRKD